MKKNALIKLTLAAMAAVVLSGCASGVKYQDMASSMQTVAPGQGRVYFFRSSSMVGAAIQPDVRLNNEVVGTSKPGGFFYVDRPAGSYSAAASTETEKTASFALASGETKYIRTSTSLGLLVGRVVVELETPEKALAELPSLSYTGAANKGAK